MELHTIGIDLGKTVFHLIGLNLRGEVVVHKKARLERHFVRVRSSDLLISPACFGA